MGQPDREELVALKGVHVLRDGNPLLRGVDWEVHGGERWVVFGPNGAGKTTLLQIVSTYVFPTRGSARVLGSRLGEVDVRTIRSRIGYVGAAPASLVHANLPPVEIVVTGKHAAFVDSRWHSYEDADWDRARVLLDQLHAGSLADRTFATLSAGEKQRVLIARALMPRPKLLLLDEATAGLDLGARERLVAALSGLAADPESPAAVFVTHHAEEIPPGFDDILVLSNGSVLASGATDATLTAELLSECFEMNLTLQRDGRRYRSWSPDAEPS